MRFSPALLALPLALSACRSAAADARRSGQVQYEGHTLAEWWDMRRGPDAETERQANLAIHMIGPAAVPFLAEKAASHELGEMIGGSSALERMCAGAVPAMEAARAEYPSPALDAAIKRVKASASNAVSVGACTASGDPARPSGRPE